MLILSAWCLVDAGYSKLVMHTVLSSGWHGNDTSIPENKRELSRQHDIDASTKPMSSCMCEGPCHLPPGMVMSVCCKFLYLFEPACAKRKDGRLNEFGRMKESAQLPQWSRHTACASVFACAKQTFSVTYFFFCLNANEQPEPNGNVRLAER